MPATNQVPFWVLGVQQCASPTFFKRKRVFACTHGARGKEISKMHVFDGKTAVGSKVNEAGLSQF